MSHDPAKISPFAPDMPVAERVRFAACQAGIRYSNRDDLMVGVLEPGPTVAGVLTRPAPR